MSDAAGGFAPPGPVRAWVLVAATLGLFAVWSNSFIVMGYLLGRDHSEARFDWVSLTVARYLPAAILCGGYLLVLRRGEALAALRLYWRRLIVCGFLVVPGYNLALYYAQQKGVSAPIASLTTALVPLFVMILAALFLAERLTSRRVIGFGVAAVGMFLISRARKTAGGESYALLIAITALAPLSWSIYSVLSKPLAGRVSPVVWTYLSITLGSLYVIPWLPGSTWRQLSNLDGAGWAALLYLSIPCTVLGFAVWTWLLRHLPATSVGFTVFLNPPLTTLSKYVVAALMPAVFVFTIAVQEWVGGVLTLIGLAIAVYRR
ncbi:MAG: EamA family transporter [Acidobacteriota bacterium]|nr:EamA family transporter [Acidobacteriota bacterium]